MFHCNKFSSEDRLFNGSLFLRQPTDQGVFDEDHEACLGSSVGPVPCVVTANERAQVYPLVARFEDIGGIASSAPQ